MAKLTPSELLKVENADLKAANAKLKFELLDEGSGRFDHAANILQLKIKINDLQKKLYVQEVRNSEIAAEESKQVRRDLLVDYAKKYKVKTEVWGYDPLTGEIIEDDGFSNNEE